MAPVSGNGPFTPRHAVISVNGAVIERDAIGREAQYHPAASPIASWTSAARALIVRELLLQEAQRLGIETVPATDDAGRRELPEEAMIRTLLDREVGEAASDEASCRAYYEANSERFLSPALYEPAHILLAAPQGDGPKCDAARLKAEELIAALRRSPEAFAELAGLHSACPSGKHGGNLGQIVPGQTVPEFEATLESLEPGQMTEKAVKTRYGFHVIRLDRRIAGRVLPFELVAVRIAGYLGEAAHRQEQQAYIRRLAASATITGFDLETGTVEPVRSADAAAPGEYASLAMRRFASQATHEDWQSLTLALDKTPNPAAETVSRMVAWSRARDESPPPGERKAEPRVAFTYSRR